MSDSIDEVQVDNRVNNDVTGIGKAVSSICELAFLVFVILMIAQCAGVVRLPYISCEQHKEAQ